MRKTYTMFAVLFLALLLSSSGIAQQLFEDEFTTETTGNLVGQNGWVAYSGTGSLPIQVVTTGLTYPCYWATTDQAILLPAVAGEDVQHPFTSVSSGSVYASAMILVNAATSTLGDYFFNFGISTSGTTFNGKLFVRKDATSGIDFGISRSGNATTTTAGVPVWASGYSTGTTYLVVLKYTFVAGTVANDRIDLYVNPDNCGNCVEPSSPTLSTTDNGLGFDAVSLSEIQVRQGTAGQVPNVIIDGIRVAQSWCDLPLPVELSSFASVVNGRNVSLNWETKTEKNSDKFVIEKQTIGTAWEAIGSVKAAVLSNSPKQYSFSDKNVNAGTFKYRLKMIDNDGTFNYSNVIEAVVSVPKNFELLQNYPNPFNPSTKINYNLPSDAKVTLDIYNVLGVRVGQLVNQDQSAGYYSVDFNSSSLSKSISSGVYLYKITTVDKVTGNNFSAIKKMMMLK